MQLRLSVEFDLNYIEFHAIPPSSINMKSIHMNSIHARSIVQSLESGKKKVEREREVRE